MADEDTEINEIEVDEEEIKISDVSEIESETAALENLTNAERECVILLLEARWLLGQLIKFREKQDKEARDRKRKAQEEENKLRGNLSLTEIQALLQAQPPDDDEDWVSKIQELKKQLAIEIRRNHMLDRDLNKLDKKIALLIKSRDPKFIEQCMNIKLKSQKKKGAKAEQMNANQNKLDAKKLEYYQDAFYLLQTEPRYLAKIIFLVQPDQMESFLETVILTLFGENFFPREELLLLKLFQKAIEFEFALIKNVSDFLTGGSVLPTMVVTYNRRKPGMEYLKKALSPIMKRIISKADDLNFELNPSVIHHQLINEMEIRTGEKSTVDKNISEEHASTIPEVKAVVEKRTKDLQEVCEWFLEGIVTSLESLPYGLRWICKQIRLTTQKKLPDCTAEDILRLPAYFAFFRFINPAIVTADSYNIIDVEMPGSVRKALVVVNKVLGFLFNLRTFGAAERHLMALNPWMQSKHELIVDYFNTLVHVDEPEDQLQVTKYMELTQKTKPVIFISPHELVMTHKILLQHLNETCPEKEDNMRIVLNDLGAPPEDIDESDDKEIQLTLNNRFKVDMEEESESLRLYTETKELMIPVLRTVPISNSIARLNLMDLLEEGINFASETSNRVLSGQINRVLENIQKLETFGLVTKNDNYESFVRDIALEVANRNTIREQQKKEIVRLTNTLESLQKHSSYINEQISDYTSYMNECRDHYRPKKKGKVKKKVGPFKFEYKELVKKKVIVESDPPTVGKKAPSFIISSDSVGVFDIEAKIAGVSVDKMQIELDDLLDRHHNGIDKLELDQVTLDVNMTLHLLNKHFRILA